MLEQIDDMLSTARKFWLAAKTPEEKSEWMGKINELLDKRLEAMNLNK